MCPNRPVLYVVCHNRAVCVYDVSHEIIFLDTGLVLPSRLSYVHSLVCICITESILYPALTSSHYLSCWTSHPLDVGVTNRASLAVIRQLSAPARIVIVLCQSPITKWSLCYARIDFLYCRLCM